MAANEDIRIYGTRCRKADFIVSLIHRCDGKAACTPLDQLYVRYQTKHVLVDCLERVGGLRVYL